MDKLPLNEDVSLTNGRRSLTTSNPSPNSAHPLPMNNKPYPVSVKVEMGTSDFFLINDPQNIFTSSGTTLKWVISPPFPVLEEVIQYIY